MNFLKYVDGAKPGKRIKITKTEEEKKNAQKEYELKRERKFQQNWLQNRSWLKYDAEKNEIYCTSCLKDNIESVFTKGTSNFKLEAIKQHETSKAHLMYLHKFEKK